MSSDTQMLIDLCEKLPLAERAEVTDFARFLLAKHEAALHEHDVVKVLKDIESDGYAVKGGMTGTIVSVYNSGEAFAVEIPALEPSPAVVTFEPDILKRIWAVGDQ